MEEKEKEGGKRESVMNISHMKRTITEILFLTLDIVLFIIKV